MEISKDFGKEIGAFPFFLRLGQENKKK